MDHNIFLQKLEYWRVRGLPQIFESYPVCLLERGNVGCKRSRVGRSTGIDIRTSRTLTICLIIGTSVYEDYALFLIDMAGLDYESEVNRVSNEARE